MNALDLGKFHIQEGKRLGFSLVELLVSITILAILAGLLVVGIGRAREAANRAESVSVLRGIGQALSLHVNEKGSLPGPLYALQVPGYTNSSRYMISHIWPFLGDGRTPPANGTLLPEYLPSFWIDYLNNNSVAAPRAYSLPVEVTGMNGSKVAPWGYPEVGGADGISRSTWFQMSANIDVSRTVMLSQRFFGSGSRTGPPPGEIQNHLAKLFFDYHIEVDTDWP
jgi:prepilin-type N-terminal cleavage/methylation domain-containing protein